MDSKARIGDALRRLRTAAGISQEDFWVVSSRTYVSTVERGLKSPTIGKLEQISSVLGVHPLTLISLAYSHTEGLDDVDDLFDHVRQELKERLAIE
jgi:transcriptional regulator with XRE-family HTH domain